MLHELYTSELEGEFLTEANLINAKTPFDGVALVAYVSDIAADLGADDVKKTFTTKISKLLMNDAKWHQAVRELPHDAPDWAQEALSAKELYAFVPDTELKDILQNLVHYITACVSASTNKNNKDEMSVALGELKGFNRSGSISELQQKAAVYYKRGSKHAGNTLEGMEEIYETNGYRWYLLTDNDAFVREGKVLQNCIGSFYTHAKCKRNGESIVVMKKANGETVVGTRITNATNTVDEMKGKNNHPPIDKYMPPVLAFLNARKMKLSHMALRDFLNAGFIYIEERLYSKAEAMAKFVKSIDVGTLANGNKLTEVDYADETLPLLDKMFAASRYNSLKSGTRLFQAVANGVTTTIHVINSTVSTIQTTKHDVVTESVNSTTLTNAQSMIEYLMQHRIATSCLGSISKELFWKHNLVFDVESMSIKHAATNSTDHGDDTHPVTSYNTDETKNLVRAQVSGRAQPKWHAISDESARHSSADDYHVIHLDSTKYPERDIILTVKGGVMTPHIVHTRNNIDDRPDGDHFHRSTLAGEEVNLAGRDDKEAIKVFRDKKVVNTIIAHANSEGVELSATFKVQHGITTNTDGKHANPTIEPKVSQNPMTLTYNVEDYSDESKIALLSYISNDRQIRTPGEAGDKHGAAYQSNHGGLRNDVFHKTINADKYGRRSVAPTPNRVKKNMSHQTIASSFATPDTMPTKLMLIDVDYGTGKQHRVCVSIKNKNVVGIDDVTLKHKFQHWDDHDNVAEQLQAVFDKHSLKIDKKLLSGTTSSTKRRTNMVPSYEFRAGAKGTLTTAAKKSHTKMDKMLSDGKIDGDDTEIPFDDGSSFVPMKSQDQIKFLRDKIRTDKVDGLAWELKHGNRVECVLMVKNKTIIKVYAGSSLDKKYEDDHDTPNTLSAVGPLVHGRVKAAMEVMDWTFHKGQVKRNEDGMGDNDDYRLLSTAYNHCRHGPGTVTFSIIPAGTKLDNPRLLDGQKQIDRLKRLGDAGLIEIVSSEKVPEKYGTLAKVTFTIDKTGKGEKVLWGVRGRDGGTETDSAKIHDSFVAPADRKAKATDAKPSDAKSTKATDAKPTKATDAKPSDAKPTKAPKAGSKAAKALDLYRSMATDGTPSRKDFIAKLGEEPFNMSKASASTYHFNTKKKYAALNETYSVLASLELMMEEYNEIHNPSSLRSLLLTGTQ